MSDSLVSNYATLFLMIALPTMVMSLANRFLGLFTAIVVGGFFTLPALMSDKFSARVELVGFIVFSALSGLLLGRWLDKKAASK